MTTGYTSLVDGTTDDVDGGTDAANVGTEEVADGTDVSVGATCDADVTADVAVSGSMDVVDCVIDGVDDSVISSFSEETSAT